jgi:hypothetical protein
MKHTTHKGQTHSCCNYILEKYGGKATCCICNPKEEHECRNTTHKKDEWKDKLAEVGFTHPPLIDFIENLLKRDRQQLIDEVEKLLKNIKVIEPPEDVEKLHDKRQAFIAGQMNVLMRHYDIITLLQSYKQK